MLGLGMIATGAGAIAGSDDAVAAATAREGGAGAGTRATFFRPSCCTSTHRTSSPRSAQVVHFCISGAYVHFVCHPSR